MFWIKNKTLPVHLTPYANAAVVSKSELTCQLIVVKTNIDVCNINTSMVQKTRKLVYSKKNKN